MGQKTLERSSQAYDKQLLSRIGGPRTPPLRSADSPATSTANEDTPMSGHKVAKGGHLRPLAMPERRYSDMDTRSPHATNWQAMQAPTNTAPQSSVLSPGISGMRSPISEDGHGMERSLSHSINRPPTTTSFIKTEEPSMPGRLVHRNSYEGVFHDQEFSAAQSPAMQQLNQSPAISEDYQNSRTGQKRRAQSPPSEGTFDPRVPTNPTYRPGHASDSRNQLPPRFQGPGSIESTASSLPHPASYGSSYGLSNPSSATSYNSERPSPTNTYSPATNMGMQPPASVNSAASRGAPTPRAPTSNAPPRPTGLWICDCCPKKPKKFDSEDELR